ncbi:glycoside hydrolase family protein [Nitrospirillum sp. BR 11828]|uniref:glycoside hydrolase family protein n=1 Tax=Nitrospirillum sp. BR 11828 TaxID=3104325 RepID=UPI002ACAE71F|nr:glycoside hydrolase family protein [Nitrospirillum sp. BR 11828]MDZ5648937.1 glycoside hydrolase family protein [Nitrospirillum sp. BR 11828]
MTLDPMALAADLRRDEGVRLKPYTDTVGKLTIGVGRNLSDVGLSVSEVDDLLAHDIDRVMADLDHSMPWWRTLSEARQRALANMAFNMGVSTLMTFRTTLAHLQAGRFEQAADAALASRWASQVGGRAQRIAALIKAG